jgi:hypothetical protein
MPIVEAAREENTLRAVAMADETGFVRGLESSLFAISSVLSSLFSG